MIVDSSALFAVVFKEPGFERVLEALANHRTAGISTATLVETGVVLSARLKKNASTLLGHLVQSFGITPVPFGEVHWRAAVGAYHTYGKGRHKAGLNFGDCITYATAQIAQAPLLYVGGDFAATDVRSVLSEP